MSKKSEIIDKLKQQKDHKNKGPFSNPGLRSYQPYWREALHCLMIDLLLIGGLIFFSVATHFRILDGWILMIAIVVLFIGEALTNYRLIILGIIEQTQGWICTEPLEYLHKDTEYAFSSRYGDLMEKLYPDYAFVARRKVYFKRQDGSKIKLRCIFYGDDDRWFEVNYKDKSLEEMVTYGKLSHIILKRKHGRITEEGLWIAKYSP